MLARYLQRIKYPGYHANGVIPDPPKPTVDTLVTLHRQHALTVPFENLSVVHHKVKLQAVPVDIESVFDKLVLKNRGGWCYEQNGLLSYILSELGFNCWSGVGRVVLPHSFKPAVTPLKPGELPTTQNPGATVEVPGLHQVVFVTLDDEVYLCDVGFGGQGLLEPLLLKPYDDEHTQEQNNSSNSNTNQPSATSSTPSDGHSSSQYVSKQSGTLFRFRRGLMGSAEYLPAAAVAEHPDADSHVGWYLQAFLHGQDTWTDLYYFTLEASTPSQFEAFNMFTYMRHHLFTKSMVVTKPTMDGRLTLLDMTFKERKEGQPTEVTELQSEEERDQLLARMFGLHL